MRASPTLNVSTDPEHATRLLHDGRREVVVAVPVDDDTARAILAGGMRTLFETLVGLPGLRCALRCDRPELTLGLASGDET
jgi:hypothetical protein